MVASRPAVFADMEDGVSHGQVGVIVLDDEIAGSTMLLSSNTILARVISVAELLYR
jgi:hypothetical protein